jgi:hypothetical protein
MGSNIAVVHRWLARLVMANLLLLFFLAGAGIFGATSFELHRTLGMLVPAAGILLLVLALAGGLGRRLVIPSAGLIVMGVIQIVLPGMRDDLPWVAALHPVNALVLMGLTSTLMRPLRTRLHAVGRPSRDAPDTGGAERVSS